MEEKLNEILEENEIKLISYEKELAEIKHKLKFLEEHNFMHEYNWLQAQQLEIVGIFHDYERGMKEIRELLNKWNS